MSRVRTSLFALALAAIPAPAFASGADVSEARLRADVEAMVAFGTRHTLSAQDNPKRGIGAALNWAEAEFRAISHQCGGCLVINRPETTISGDRIPAPTRLANVVAFQRGTDLSNDVVIVQAHIDSRASDVMDAASDAPGANDNASGSALVLEAARLLSRRRYSGNIVYALLSGEEQGLYGGKLLADWAKLQGWTVKAVLNNDIVGGSRGSDGLVDADHVRVFSEGPRADATDGLRAGQRRFGGENDSPSRNLSRFVAGLAERQGGLAVRQVWRADRMGRGGDHLPFQEAGLPAIRFSAAIEDYDHQHQDLRVENGVTYGDTVDEMDFAYLARVTRLNVAALDALARAPMPPRATADGAVKTFTEVKWAPVAGAASYRVWWRRTDEAGWSASKAVSGDRQSLRLDGVRGDDWIFGVSAVAADGSESPVSSAVPGGQFFPVD
ncbi:MAG: hypothetical protein RIQ46_1885 [Pseudomonadota bacterium]